MSKETVTASAPVHQLVGQRDDRVNDYYRLNYIERLYSDGSQKKWHEFMVLVCQYGFRRASDMCRLPNAKADLAPASGAQVQRLVGCELSTGEKP